MEYIGNVFRPPSEARSLILQVTIGCSHNKCTFCYMYKGEPFRIKPLQQILREIAELNYLRDHVERVFLADGDALILKKDHLITILRALYTTFPYLKRVGIYSSPKSIFTKSLEDLQELKKEGLHIAYLGMESGSDSVLHQVQKGADAKEILKAGKLILNSGIKLSVTMISGLGGKAQWQEHALESAKLVSALNPHYLGLLTLRLYSNAELKKEVEEGRFQVISPLEILDETELFLKNLTCEGVVFRSNHASNYYPLAGVLKEDVPRLLEEIEKGRKYQNFRPEVLRGF